MFHSIILRCHSIWIIRHELRELRYCFHALLCFIFVSYESKTSKTKEGIWIDRKKESGSGRGREGNNTLEDQKIGYDTNTMTTISWETYTIRNTWGKQRNRCGIKATSETLDGLRSSSQCWRKEKENEERQTEKCFSFCSSNKFTHIEYL